LKNPNNNKFLEKWEIIQNFEKIAKQNDWLWKPNCIY
jgi:hypothetical protein